MITMIFMMLLIVMIFSVMITMVPTMIICRAGHVIFRPPETTRQRRGCQKQNYQTD